MSVVSGVVLCMSAGEEEMEDELAPLLVEVNRWLAARGAFRLDPVEDGFGGSKHPQMIVAGGGFNHFDEDAFAEFVLGLPWGEPENVVLIIQPEDGPTRVFRPERQSSDVIETADNPGISRTEWTPASVSKGPIQWLGADCGRLCDYTYDRLITAEDQRKIEHFLQASAAADRAVELLPADHPFKQPRAGFEQLAPDHPWRTGSVPAPDR